MENQELFPITSSQLRATNFQIFSHLDEKTRKSQVNAFRYAEQMAGLLGINISSWPVMQVFSEDGKLLLTERKALNKRLIAYDKVDKEADKYELPSDQAALIDEAVKVFDRHKERKIMELETAQESSRRQANDYLMTANTYLTKAWQFHQQILGYRGLLKEHIASEIKATVKNPFWKYVRTGFDSRFGGQTILFHTANPITLAIRNPSMGLDLSVSMGTYAVGIYLDHMRILVFPLENNAYSDVFYHPYISDTGKICWGNAADQAAKLISEGKLSEVMELLAANLSNYYHDSSPYRSLESFHAAQQTREQARATATTERRCPTCEALESDCECHYCPHCDVNYSRNPCREHWCDICEGYNRPNCECCTNCEHTEGNCTCCPNCDSPDQEDCGCCQECERSSSTLDSRGHRPSCSEYAPPTEPTEF